MTKQHTYCKLQLVTVLWIVQLYSSYPVQTIQLNVLQTAQFRWVADHSASSIIIVLHLQKSETRMTASVRKFADCVSVSINQPYIWNLFMCLDITFADHTTQYATQATQPANAKKTYKPLMLQTLQTGMLQTVQPSMLQTIQRDIKPGILQTIQPGMLKII